MKVIFVTSEVTYVPQNCLFFFNEVLRNNPSNISGLIIIKNNSLDLLPKAMWLYALGCKNFACCLIHNIVELPLEKRGRLFKKNSLPVLKVKNINDPKIISWIKRNKIDLIINIRTRSILFLFIQLIIFGSFIFLTFKTGKLFFLNKRPLFSRGSSTML